jgi:hypothetical protein
VSFLTRLFVILLVVVSMLNAAATVVFVNKEGATAEANDALTAKNNSLARERDDAVNELGTARAKLEEQQELSASEATTAQTRLDSMSADLASKDADNKQLLRNNQAQEANLQGLDAQLAIALETNKQDMQTLNDLRDTNAKLLDSQAETDAALARQRELADTNSRQVEYLSEQLKKSEDKNKAYAAVIEEHHLSVPTEGVTPLTFSGPTVSGIVQDKQAINGVTYVTISVGKSDNVQPGMEFRIVDSSAQPPQFLGIVTVTEVQSDTSIGRLRADNGLADHVGKGDEVTSDMQ